MGFAPDTLLDRVAIVTGASRDAGQVDQAVARTVETFGRIDLLVNNAGYRIRAPPGGSAQVRMGRDAAKAGAAVLTRSLGAEWAKYGITVNAVASGPVETEGVLRCGRLRR